MNENNNNKIKNKNFTNYFDKNKVNYFMVELYRHGKKVLEKTIADLIMDGKKVVLLNYSTEDMEYLWGNLKKRHNICLDDLFKNFFIEQFDDESINELKDYYSSDEYIFIINMMKMSSNWNKFSVEDKCKYTCELLDDLSDYNIIMFSEMKKNYNINESMGMKMSRKPKKQLFKWLVQSHGFCESEFRVINTENFLQLMSDYFD